LHHEPSITGSQGPKLQSESALLAVEHAQHILLLLEKMQAFLHGHSQRRWPAWLKNIQLRNPNRRDAKSRGQIENMVTTPNNFILTKP
jgi:hypothetical protein